MEWAPTAIRMFWPYKGPTKSRWCSAQGLVGHFHRWSGASGGADCTCWQSWQSLTDFSIFAVIPGHIHSGEGLHLRHSWVSFMQLLENCLSPRCKDHYACPLHDAAFKAENLKVTRWVWFQLFITPTRPTLLNVLKNSCQLLVLLSPDLLLAVTHDSSKCSANSTSSGSSKTFAGRSRSGRWLSASAFACAQLILVIGKKQRPLFDTRRSLLGCRAVIL